MLIIIKDSLAKLSSNMHTYYCDKSFDELIFMEKTNKEQWEKNLFIYHDHQNDLYLRTKIIELFAGRKVC